MPTAPSLITPPGGASPSAPSRVATERPALVVTGSGTSAINDTYIWDAANDHYINSGGDYKVEFSGSIWEIRAEPGVFTHHEGVSNDDIENPIGDYSPDASSGTATVAYAGGSAPQLLTP